MTSVRTGSEDTGPTEGRPHADQGGDSHPLTRERGPEETCGHLHLRHSACRTVRNDTWHTHTSSFPAPFNNSLCTPGMFADSPPGAGHREGTGFLGSALSPSPSQGTGPGQRVAFVPPSTGAWGGVSCFSGSPFADFKTQHFS